MLYGCLQGRISQSLSVCRLSLCQCYHSSDRWRAARGPFLLRWERGERPIKRGWIGHTNHNQMKHVNEHVMGQIKHCHPIHHHFDPLPHVWKNGVEAHLHWDLLIYLLLRPFRHYRWSHSLMLADVPSSLICFSWELRAAIDRNLVFWHVRSVYIQASVWHFNYMTSEQNYSPWTWCCPTSCKSLLVARQTWLCFGWCYEMQRCNWTQVLSFFLFLLWICAYLTGQSLPKSGCLSLLCGGEGLQWDPGLFFKFSVCTLMSHDIYA